MKIYWKKQSLKLLWLEALEGQKAACQRKHNDWKKGKTLTLGSNLAVAEGCGDGGEVADEWEPECRSQVHVTA
jgi:hypothetical protein